MLSQVKFSDFKNFRDQEVRLAPLTLLVGANATGKSNLLDALRFLQGLAQGMTLTDVLRGRWEGGHEVWPGVRGGLQEVARRGSDRFGIESKWQLDQVEVSHRIVCRTDGHAVVERETLRAAGHGRYLFDTEAAGGDGKEIAEDGKIPVAVKPRDEASGEIGEYPANRSLLVQIADREPAEPAVGVTSEKLRQALRSAVFIEIMPRLMRDYVPKQLDHLGAHGENVSAVVWQLCREENRRRDLVDWLSEVCAPPIADVDFVETDLGDVMLQLVEVDGSRISARSLSDGTLRFLGVLTAILTAPHGTLVLLEEIENGLHPARLHLMTELLESAAQERGIQVLATTHSPRALLAASPGTLRNAVVFGRHAEASGAVMRRLEDLPNFGEVVKRRSIDHLFATGWLERAL